MTAFGYLLIPLACYCFVLRPSWLLPLAIISAVFEAASVFNTASFGLPPYYFVALLIAIKLFTHLHSRLTFGGETWIKIHLVLLLSFVIWGGATIFILPELFEGISVYAPRGGIDTQAGGGTPLKFSTSNLAQFIYLLLNVSVVLFSLVTVQNRHGARRLTTAFYFSGLLVLIFGMYQLLATRLGLPYPYSFLQSNPFRSTTTNNTYLNLLRINSTFSETSTFSSFATAYLTFVWFLFVSFRQRIILHLSIISITAMLLIFSTSTTAYAGLGLVLLLISGLHIFWPLIRGRAKLKVLMTLILVFYLGSMVILSSPGIQTVIQDAVINKPESESFSNRTASDQRALEIFVETHGLGVGLGSNRPSSFATWLLSNVGILGFLLLFGAVMALGLCLARVRKGREKSSLLGICTFWALIIVILSKIISSPDLSTPTMWILWALSLCAASVSYRERGKAFSFSTFSASKPHQTAE